MELRAPSGENRESAVWFVPSVSHIYSIVFQSFQIDGKPANFHIIPSGEEGLQSQPGYMENLRIFESTQTRIS